VLLALEVRTMKRQLAVATIALATLMACSGRAVSPSSAGASHVTFEDGDAKHEVSGVAFAQREAGEKRLVVYTFHEKTEPSPSCELLASPQNMTRGGFISLVVSSFDGAPGSYTAGQTGVLLGDPDKGDITMLSKPLTGTSVTFRSFDDESFTGSVTSAGSTPKLTGSFSGTICPGSASTTAAAPEPPEPKPVAKPAVVRRLDAEGVLGIKLGKAPATFPKGVSKKPHQPDWPKGTDLYSGKAITYLETPLEGADILVVDGVVVQVAVGSTRCDALLAKLKERFGEGEKNDFMGMTIWTGESSELRLAPKDGGKCVLTLDKKSSL
jgi:hypothetical protein